MLFRSAQRHSKRRPRVPRQEIRVEEERECRREEERGYESCAAGEHRACVVYGGGGDDLNKNGWTVETGLRKGEK